MAGTESKDIQALARQIEVLKNEVTQLRLAVESLQAIQPTITSLYARIFRAIPCHALCRRSEGLGGRVS